MKDDGNHAVAEHEPNGSPDAAFGLWPWHLARRRNSGLLISPVRIAKARDDVRVVDHHHVRFRNLVANSGMHVIKLASALIVFTCALGGAGALTTGAVRPSALLSRTGRSRRPSRATCTAAATSGDVLHRFGSLTAVTVGGDVNAKKGSIVEVDGSPGLVLYKRNELDYVFVPSTGLSAAKFGGPLMVDETALPPGTVLDWAGRPHAAGVATGAVEGEEPMHRDAFTPALAQKDRISPRAGLLTGITAIDVLAPVGRGQNMLIIGPTDESPTSLALDMLLAQRESDVETMYIAMRPPEEMADIAARVGCTAVASTDAGEFIASLTTASALAEMRRDRGAHVCLVIDDMQPMRKLWEFMQESERLFLEANDLAADAPSMPVDAGIRDDATGSELRTFYASFLDRAGACPTSRGGGSLTVVQLARKPSLLSSADSDGEEEGHPLSAFDPACYPQSMLERLQRLDASGVALTNSVLAKLRIPSPESRASTMLLEARRHIDECISLADGHLLIEEALARTGVRPAIEVRDSLSRIGLGKSKGLQSTPMAAAIRQIAPRLRLELAMASDALASGQVTAADRRTFAWRAVLQQPESAPRSLRQTVLALYAAANGCLDDLHGADLGAACERAYERVERVCAEHPALLAHVTMDHELTADEERELASAFASVSK